MIMSQSQIIENSNPLTGKELMERLASLGDLPRSKQAIACGYAYPNTGRANIAAFCKAIADAAVPFVQKKRGRTVKNSGTVTKANALLISRFWVNQIGAESGDRVKIEAIETDGETKIVISKFSNGVGHGS